MFNSLIFVRRTVLIIICSVPLFLVAQSVDFNNYSPLKSQDPLSSKLAIPIEEKIDQMKERYKLLEIEDLAEISYFNWSIHQ